MVLYGIASRSSAGVRFSRATRRGLESNIFTRLLGRLLGLLIDQSIRPSIDDEHSVSQRDTVQIQPIRNVASAPLLVEHVSAVEGIQYSSTIDVVLG